MSSEQNLNSSLSTVLYYVSFPKLPNSIIWFVSYCNTQYLWETLGKSTSIENVFPMLSWALRPDQLMIFFASVLFSKVLKNSSVFLKYGIISLWKLTYNVLSTSFVYFYLKPVLIPKKVAFFQRNLTRTKQQNPQLFQSVNIQYLCYIAMCFMYWYCSSVCLKYSRVWENYKNYLTL